MTSNTHGFELERDEQIDELNTRARLWRHTQSGAQFLSLENDDENKVFGIAFRTPPEDSTGVAHIMEHAVLAGSRKYRLKEPFIELVKGSLNTFLNAFTYPDRTVYPVASTNLQDYYNLVDVYLDAVFFPLITRHHLDQEGWHYELDELEDPLIYKGVVFNEMKGAFSSPDSVLHRYSFQSLFPDNPYGHESGGDPEAIPDLTYEQFTSFHELYYHPSNALIFMYGDDDPEERLRILNGYLSEFQRADIESAVALQQPFETVRRQSFAYSVDDGQENGHTPKSLVQLNWALPEFEDATLAMALEVLSYALVGTQASPLRKALIDSGLGEDVTGGGLSTSTRQMTFSAGLKGVEPEKVDEVESVVLETLQQLSENGFEADMIEAAVNTIDFSLRENNTGSYPRGLGLLIAALDTWTYDRDPLLAIRYEEPLREVKEAVKDDPRYLQKLIDTYLLDNRHRATVILQPDTRLAKQQEEREAARLAAVRDGLTEAELQSVINNTRELRLLQETPDSPEALATLPMLTLEDLDPLVTPIPIEVSDVGGSKLLYHDLFTNGIAYFDVGFDLQALPQALLPYAGLLGSLLLSMGTETEDYVKLSQRMGRKTGGIGSSIFTSAVKGSDRDLSRFFLSGKSTVEQAPDLFEILSDVLLTANFDNRERFRQIVLRAKASAESGLIPGGHAVVNSRLRAHFHPSDWAAEQIDGVDNLFFLRKLERQIESDWPSVLEELELLRQYAINRNSMLINATVDAGSWQRIEGLIPALAGGLPGGQLERQVWTPPELPINEGLTIPAQVNYVGKGANIYELGYELDGSISVISNLLRTTWLWEKIRIQGGAYGAFSSFNRETGILTFLSYRDPNFATTLEAYDNTSAFLRSVDLNSIDLTRSIIGAIGNLDAYQLPDSKGHTSMVRYLLGLSDEQRQQYRTQVLGTTVEHFRAFADVLDQVATTGQVVVLGSADTIAKANQPEPWLDVLTVM